METKVKHDVVVIGELNVDIILNRIMQFPEIGKEILAESMSLTLGSSSAIFASNLSMLGSAVAFIGKIGNDSFASVVLDSLNSKGVETSHIVQSNTVNTGATIVLNYDQDRANITYPGAMEDLKLSDIDFDFLSSARHVHFSSVFLQPGIRNSVHTLFSNAKSLGLTTSLDPQWDPSEKWEINLYELLPSLDLFMPNKAEFYKITGTKSIEEGIEKIRKIAPNITLVIKDGSNGAFGWKAGHLIHQPAFLNSEIVDCIGAGDSFNSGFIFSFLKGSTLQECLYFGNVTGALNTTSDGGTGAFKSKSLIRKVAKEKFNILIDI